MPAGRLDPVLCAGDILSCRNNNNWEIGAMGGYFGHVMLVTAPAQCIPAGSSSAREFASVWPQERSGVTDLWAVPIVESTRAEKGLREATLLVYVQQPSGSLVIAAELSSDDELAECEDNYVEVWQSPTQLRDLTDSCPPHLITEVFAEMKKDMRWSDWSELTAVKAALMPATLDSNCEGLKALAQIRESWAEKPICTSVAIAFWQRLLCKLAPLLNVGLHQNLADRTMSLIRKWMPIRADRSLPSEMSDALHSAGWNKIVHVRNMVTL